MGKAIGWIIVIALIIYAYQAGWIAIAINSMNEFVRNSQKEQVIEHADGTVTTVKYKNIFSLFSKE